MTAGLIDETLIDALPEGYTARPAHMKDLEGVVQMLNEYAIDLIGHAQFRLSDLMREWELESWSLDKYSRIVEAPDGSLAGWMEVWNWPPHVRPFLWGRVHPNHRGHGISTALVRWAETVARQEVDRAEPGTKVTLGAQAESADRDAYALLSGLGFEEVRRFWRMEIPFEGQEPPAPEWPEGITVRAVRNRDEEREAFRVVDTAFKDHWGHVDVPFEEAFERWSVFTFTDDYDPSVRFLAMDGDEIIGVSLNRINAPENDQYAWIGQLGVLREYRGRGIAKALLLHSFREFYQRGKLGVGLGVDASSLTGATKLYENVGMHVAREVISFNKTLRDGIDLATRSL